MLTPFLLIGIQVAARISLFDQFDRNVTQHGFDLVVWGGPIANPAVKLRVQAKITSYPATIFIHADSPLVQFDRSKDTDRYGIGRYLRLTSPKSSTSFYAEMLPDRTARPKSARLWIQVFGPNGRETQRASVPIQVVDMTRPDSHPRYPIIPDFSQDKTGFFQSAAHRRIVREVDHDWSYFLDDLGEDATPVGSETSEMWEPDGFKTKYTVVNHSAYRGVLLYYAGIDFDEWRSGGAPSPYGKVQTIHGAPTSLLRSGTVNVETAGNYNRLGYFLTRSDSDWWVSGNQRNEPNDLYSIMLHETGHAIAFNPNYLYFNVAKRKGELTSPQILAYFGKPAKIDASDHFPGLIDPVSGYGCFGNEYHGWMATRRWLITKGDLILLQAIGYKIRHTAAFAVLTAQSSNVRFRWDLNSPATGRIELSGGVPDYDFTVVKGSLPPGVSMNSYTGDLMGKPSAKGKFLVQVEVRDSDPTSKPIHISMDMDVS